MNVLIDTSAMFALVDTEDDGHEAATTVFADLVRSDQMTMHSYAVVEATALIQNRLGMAALRLMHERILPTLVTRWIDSEIHAVAVAALLAADARRVSFVDRVSFEVMRRDGIDAAFAFDKDFASQGFRTIPS